jgi:putative transposase/transposase-like zinc-binding protein
MPTLAEVFAAHWPAYASRHGGRMPWAHACAARAILACRTPASGMVRRVCAGCAKVHIAPLSCGHRACPQCGTAQARLWEQRRLSKLLPVPHFLVTLTVPEELRAALRACPREGYGAMFRAAAIALRASVAKTKLGGTPGWTAVLHTWTRQLGHHPHLHLIVAGCALSQDGALRVARPDYLVPSHLLAARWREALAEELTVVAKSDPRLQAMLAEVPARTWARRWNPDILPVGCGAKAMGYLARYVQKTALDHARLLRLDAAQVVIGWRERPKHPSDGRGLARQTPLSPDEFLRRFLQHVLPGGFQRVRHGGFYSAAARESYGRVTAILAHRPPPPEEPWQARCEDCGGVLQVQEIRVGRILIIPRAAQLRRLAALASQRDAAGQPTQERAP